MTIKANRTNEMEYECEICGETKPCGKIVAFRATKDGGWEPTSETIVCGSSDSRGGCAEAVGGVAAASVKSWLAKASK